MNWNAELFKSARNGDLERVKECLANGADMNIKDNDGKTALMYASKAGYLEIVKYLIESIATALRDASSNRTLERVKYLIENGADINAKDNDGYTILMESSWRGYLEVVKYIIANGADVNIRDNEGKTALMIASKAGHLEVVKYLIENGADVNAKDNKGNTTLDFAKTNKWGQQQFIDEIEFLINAANADWKKQLFISISKGDLDKVKQCLTNGADVNASGYYCTLSGYRGGTALMCASMEGHSNIVKCLIENGADVNVKNDNGRTALDCAKRAVASYEQNDRFNEIEFLINSANADWTKQLFSSVSKCNLAEIKQCLANGADVNAKDSNGKTTLRVVTMGGYYNVYSRLVFSSEQLEVVKYLIENGADVNAKDGNGRTELMETINSSKCNFEIVKLLVQSGADVNAKDNDGCTALSWASVKGYIEMVKLLVENGADINAKDNDGWTALMDASYNGYFEVVKYLILNGADINVKGNDNKTALDVAQTDEIALFLIDVANRNR